jgi:hypothetical protein
MSPSAWLMAVSRLVMEVDYLARTVPVSMQRMI